MRGSMLKQILDDKGITISELARRLNAPAQTLYSMVKRDNQKVDFDLMMRICSELNVPVERDDSLCFVLSHFVSVFKYEYL